MRSRGSLLNFNKIPICGEFEHLSQNARPGGIRGPRVQRAEFGIQGDTAFNALREDARVRRARHALGTSAADLNAWKENP